MTGGNSVGDSQHKNGKAEFEIEGHEWIKMIRG